MQERNYLKKILNKNKYNSKYLRRYLTVHSEIVELRNDQFYSENNKLSKEKIQKLRQNDISRFRAILKQYLRLSNPEIKTLIVAAITEYKLNHQSKLLAQVIKKILKSKQVYQNYDYLTFISDYYYKNKQYKNAFKVYQFIFSHFSSKVTQRQRMNYLWSHYKLDKFKLTQKMAITYFEKGSVDKEVYKKDLITLILYSSILSSQLDTGMDFYYQYQDFVGLDIKDIFEVIEKKSGINVLHQFKMNRKNKGEEKYISFLLDYWTFLLESNYNKLSEIGIKKDFKLLVKKTTILSQYSKKREILVNEIKKRIVKNQQLKDKRYSLNDLFYYNHLIHFDPDNKDQYYLLIAKELKNKSLLISFNYLLKKIDNFKPANKSKGYRFLISLIEQDRSNKITDLKKFKILEDFYRILDRGQEKIKSLKVLTEYALRLKLYDKVASYSDANVFDNYKKEQTEYINNLLIYFYDRQLLGPYQKILKILPEKSKGYSDFVQKRRKMQLDKLLDLNMSLISRKQINQIMELLEKGNWDSFNISKVDIYFNLFLRSERLKDKLLEKKLFTKLIKQRKISPDDINKAYLELTDSLLEDQFVELYTQKMCKGKAKYFSQNVLKKMQNSLLIVSKKERYIKSLMALYDSCGKDFNDLGAFLITYPYSIDNSARDELKNLYCKAKKFNKLIDSYLYIRKLDQMPFEQLKAIDLNKILKEAKGCSRITTFNKLLDIKSSFTLIEKIINNLNRLKIKEINSLDKLISHFDKINLNKDKIKSLQNHSSHYIKYMSYASLIEINTFVVGFLNPLSKKKIDNFDLIRNKVLANARQENIKIMKNIIRLNKEFRFKAFFRSIRASKDIRFEI